MSFKNILAKVAAETGSADLLENPDQRERLTIKIDEAAEEIWEETDLPGSLRELFIILTNNKQIALPSFVGQLRAVRDPNLNYKLQIQDMRPRYHRFPWEKKWDKFNFVGTMPLQADIVNIAPLTYSIEVADPNLTVTTTGVTATQSKAIESVTMTSKDMVGIQQFEEIQSIVLNKYPDYNVFVKDVEGNILSEIQNNSLEARYLIYNISEYPENSIVNRTLEILYKIPRPPMIEDTDVFPVPGYDNIVAMKAIQLIAELIDGQEDRVLLLEQKIKSRMVKKMQHQEAGTQRKVALTGPKFNRMTLKYRYFGRRFSHRYF